MSIKNNLYRIVDKEHFAYWGVLGSAIGFIFVLSSMIGYVGSEGESYSMLNHFISELGEL